MYNLVKNSGPVLYRMKQETSLLGPSWTESISLLIHPFFAAVVRQTINTFLDLKKAFSRIGPSTDRAGLRFQGPAPLGHPGSDPDPKSRPQPMENPTGNGLDSS